MKIAKIMFFAAAAFFAAVLGAQNLPPNAELAEAPSASMGKKIGVVVVLPKNYTEDAGARYPAVYLLHGFGGDHTTWALKTKPNLHDLASELGVIFVCPDGSTSWYWDAPKDPASRYETFVSKELVEFIDKNYRTIPSAKCRAITGFSMGGHGGLWLGFRHPEVFGMCGSMSGGVDIRPFPLSWKMQESLGPYSDNEGVWDGHTVINQLHRLNAKNMPAIIIDCGTSDFFYDVNEALHKKMLYMKIPHEYVSRPGSHTHEYWRNAIDFQLEFFRKRFQRQ